MKRRALGGRGFTRTAGGAAILVAGLLQATVALAAGAIALGTTGDPSGDGIGVSGTANERSKASAIASVLSKCRSGADTAAAGARCRVVVTFSGQCFAFASARDADQSGPAKGLVALSWGLGSSKEDAKSQAVDKCNNAAPDGYTCYAGFSACDAGGDVGSGDVGGSPSGNGWYAIAASKRTKQEAQGIAARLGSPWSVKNSRVCSNHTQGLWIVVASAGDRGSASALASQVGGYAKECR